MTAPQATQKSTMAHADSASSVGLSLGGTGLFPM